MTEIEKQCNAIIEKLAKTSPKFRVTPKQYKWWKWIISPISNYRLCQTARLMEKVMQYDQGINGQKYHKALRELIVKGKTEIRTEWSKWLDYC